MNRSTPGLPVHHQLLEFTQTHVHRAIYITVYANIYRTFREHRFKLRTVKTPRILTLLKFQDTINTNDICVMHHNLEAISHRFTVESDVRKLRAKSAASVYLCLSHLTLFYHYIFSYLIYVIPISPLSELSFLTPRCC